MLVKKSDAPPPDHGRGMRLICSPVEPRRVESTRSYEIYAALSLTLTHHNHFSWPPGQATVAAAMAVRVCVII